MSRVSRILEQQFDKPYTISVMYTGELRVVSYKYISSMGFSAEDDNILLLFRPGIELPSVIINMDNVKSIEVIEGVQDYGSRLDSETTDRAPE